MVGRHPQQGAALLVVLLLVVTAAATLFAIRLQRAQNELEADRKTSQALAQAKQALIGYAATQGSLTGSGRPGDLPCPAPDGSGVAATSCGNAAGTTGQSARLGRLPWHTLGIGDLRDGYGEPLWYAVSSNFKNNTRIAILNSDTGTGTITVRNQTGGAVMDGTGTTGAIAVIIAPGPSIQRADGVVQNRGGVGANQAVNFLDIGLSEDNADFADATTNGFIGGIVRNASGGIVVNDRIATISYQELMPVLEKRVAGEVLACLRDYAAQAVNQGRYPWVAPLNPLAVPGYLDVSGARFGRLPDTPFTNTRADSGGLMDDTWTAKCNLNATSGWWLNWKEMVFYALADAYKPVPLGPLPPPAACGGSGTCLIVNPPSAAASRQVVVMVAGRRLSGVAGGQPRASNSDKGSIANYLESQNASPADDIFERSASSSSFNDMVLFAP